MRKSRFLAGLAALAVVAVGVPAQAQSVPVTLVNPSGNRVVTIEDMTGANLTTLDFGTSRELPFRVRVQDNDYARRDFSVSATMTNLYVDNAGTPDYTKKIASSDVGLDSQLNPLNVLGVSATVQPVVNTVTTLVDTTLCGVLGLTVVNSACVLNTTNITGKVINDLTINVDNLTTALPKLPLLPQANEKGPFTNPSYASGTVGFSDPAKTATPATPLLLASGDKDITPVLTELNTAIDALPLASVVNPSDVIAKLQAQLPLVWGLLDTAEINAILAATDAVPVPLTVDGILSLTGTYISLPTLKVNVPTTASAGNYKGTMVVTSVQ